MFHYPMKVDFFHLSFFGKSSDFGWVCILLTCSPTTGPLLYINTVYNTLYFEIHKQ